MSNYIFVGCDSHDKTLVNKIALNTFVYVSASFAAATDRVLCRLRAVPARVRGKSRSSPTVESLPTNRSPSQDRTNGSTVLDLSAKDLEGLEVGLGDCPTRNGGGLASEAFQTLLVPIIPAQESRPASYPGGNPKARKNDG